jgi:hypothetical protein
MTITKTVHTSNHHLSIEPGIIFRRFWCNLVLLLLWYLLRPFGFQAPKYFKIIKVSNLWASSVAECLNQKRVVCTKSYIYGSFLLIQRLTKIIKNDWELSRFFNWLHNVVLNTRFLIHLTKNKMKCLIFHRYFMFVHEIELPNARYLMIL